MIAALLTLAMAAAPVVEVTAFESRAGALPYLTAAPPVAVATLEKFTADGDLSEWSDAPAGPPLFITPTGLTKSTATVKVGATANAIAFAVAGMEPGATFSWIVDPDGMRQRWVRGQAGPSGTEAWLCSYDGVQSEERYLLFPRSTPCTEIDATAVIIEDRLELSVAKPDLLQWTTASEVNANVKGKRTAGTWSYNRGAGPILTPGGGVKIIAPPTALSIAWDEERAHLIGTLRGQDVASKRWVWERWQDGALAETGQAQSEKNVVTFSTEWTEEPTGFIIKEVGQSPGLTRAAASIWGPRPYMVGLTSAVIEDQLQLWSRDHIGRPLVVQILVDGELRWEQAVDVPRRDQQITITLPDDWPDQFTLHLPELDRSWPIRRTPHNRRSDRTSSTRIAPLIEPTTK